MFLAEGGNEVNIELNTWWQLMIGIERGGSRSSKREEEEPCFRLWRMRSTIRRSVGKVFETRLQSSLCTGLEWKEFFWDSEQKLVCLEQSGQGGEHSDMRADPIRQSLSGTGESLRFHPWRREKPQKDLEQQSGMPFHWYGHWDPEGWMISLGL